MEYLADFLTKSEWNTAIIAISTVILTELFKLPVKLLAQKSSNANKITRFIIFLPLAIGFGLTVLMTYLLTNKIVFNDEFFTQWLSAVSLSLAVYAFLEKFVPSEKKILSELEVHVNETVVEELKSKLVDTATASEIFKVTRAAIQSAEETQEGQSSNYKKIILTKKNKK